MDFRSWPRHQLRASGRQFGRPGNAAPRELPPKSIQDEPQQKERSDAAYFKGVFGQEPPVSQVMSRPAEAYDSVETGKQNATVEFLNYLSHSAAVAEREILEPKFVPDFATVRGLELLAPRKVCEAIASPAEWDPRPLNAAQTASRGYLSELAELLSEHAESVVCKPAEPRCQTEELNSERLSAVTLLDRWLSDGAAPELEEQELDDYYDEADYDTIYGDAAYADEPSMDEVRTAVADERAGEPESLTCLAGAQQLKQSRMPRTEPDLKLLPGGRRRERFETGAEIIKDSLGRVIEVRSPLGPVLRARYDDRGDLRFFVRTDCGGNLESYGEGDKHGVIVRDPSGRVRAAGETMTVDRVGRLSIVRRDGQFWSIDMARGLHVERRQLADDDGRWRALTAVFAFDGFRMVTRFQSMDNDQADSPRPAVTETIRLYGRDGSVIEFDSEDDIEALRPARVWPPASRKVDKSFRGKWQAGTAWQAVKEYVELLRSGSG